MARIALDAMGGDLAPQATVAGALHAIQEMDRAHTIQLVGQTAVIEQALSALLQGELAAAASHRDRIEIVEAPDLVGMNDKPTAVLRRPECSMMVGLRMQTEDRSDAFVSAGNTGAQMAASTVLLKLHEGLTRPAISTLFPTARQPIVVLDSGANVDCSPDELVQFARLGVVYAEDLLGRKDPVVGLLSIGEEEEKGNTVTKATYKLLQNAGINFQGNVEGRDLPLGKSDRGPIDVVVCDGFVGNVLLKFYESVAPMIMGLLAESGIDRGQLQKAFKNLDYTAYGGAPLLGVRGISIICHGKSSPRAIKNAIRVALQAVETHMDENIGKRLAAAAPIETA